MQAGKPALRQTGMSALRGDGDVRLSASALSRRLLIFIVRVNVSRNWSNQPARAGRESDRPRFLTHKSRQPVFIFEVLVHDRFAGADLDHLRIALVGSVTAQGRRFDVRYVIR